MDGCRIELVMFGKTLALDIQRSETKILHVPWDIFKDVVDSEWQILELQVDFSKKAFFGMAVSLTPPLLTINNFCVSSSSSTHTGPLPCL
jgi:hypothetical protein